jgi:hypothetical protein
VAAVLFRIDEPKTCRARDQYIMARTATIGK